jgi:ParB/RepB/Spo0J family partition protein
MSAKLSKPMDETQGKHYIVDTRYISELNRAEGNVREDYGEGDGSLEELVLSIQKNGIKKPITCFRDLENAGHWIVIDGHRRLRAAKILNEQGTVIRCRVFCIDGRTISDEDIITEMVISNEGKALKPIELAEAVRRMLGYEFTEDQIAKMWGKTVVQIRNLSLLSKAPNRIKKMVSNNKLSATLAIDVLKKTPDFDEAISLIEKAGGVVVKSKSEPGVEEPKELLEKKVTKKDITEAMNIVDSQKELKLVMKKDNSKRTVKDQNMYNLLKKIVDNSITGAEIENLLFVD